MAIQTAASSGAHLTKYSNITDVSTGQKKLIVDEAIVPVQPVFDYEVTFGAPVSLTADGALDGIAHSLEVLYGAVGKPYYEHMEDVAVETIKLVLEYLPKVIENPEDAEAREALGLATDLGGYAIMLGGTNGGHLTSFSLVDVLSHGRACAIMNPYYTVFFAPAIQEPLQLAGPLYKASGDTDAALERSVRPRAGRGRGRGHDALRGAHRLPGHAGRGARLHRCAHRPRADRGQEPAAQDEAGEHARAAHRRHGGRVHGPGAGGGKTGDLSLIKTRSRNFGLRLNAGNETNLWQEDGLQGFARSALHPDRAQGGQPCCSPFLFAVTTLGLEAKIPDLVTYWSTSVPCQRENEQRTRPVQLSVEFRQSHLHP